MAISIRMAGSVTDAPRRLTYTRSGLPRFQFGVRVGALKPKHYLVTAYGTIARFADIYLRTGQRIRIEGAYLRRYPLHEGLVRADTIRHVGLSAPPASSSVKPSRFVPQRPRRGDEARRTAPAQLARRIPAESVDAALGAALA